MTAALTPRLASVHAVSFFHSATDRARWRAECSCGWSHEGAQADVQMRAAGHDLDEERRAA